MPENSRAEIMPGSLIPDAYLADLDSDGEVRRHHTEDLFIGRNAILVGVPGAFTPVCTHQHLPRFIETADQFAAKGYGAIFCICASDPFTTMAWARLLDPQRRIRFLSDGNLAFASACGLTTMEEALFLGMRSKRYVMTLESSVIKRLKVEDNIELVTCTSADALML